MSGAALPAPFELPLQLPHWQAALPQHALLAASFATAPPTPYTCLAGWLAGCRYAATAGNEGESIPLAPSGSRSPLPTEFSRQLAGVFSAWLPGFWLASWALR